MLDFLNLKARESKPRQAGLTHVLDKGLGPRQVRDLLETAADSIDIIKLGWGTGYVTSGLTEKIELYRQAGIPVCFGGTLLEAAIAQNRFDEFRRAVRGLGLDHVEFSTGVVDLPLETKIGYVRALAEEFTVLAEVGSKDAEAEVVPERWIEEIEALIRAGAWKVIAEARESGTAGIFHATGKVRACLVDSIVAKFDSARMLFEAPQKSQQVWFLKKLGPSVNLGNIAPEEVIPLETLRLGLRGDTLPDFLVRG